MRYLLSKLIEKLTGRKCSSCAHNRGGRCCHPSGSMFMKCWHSITRPGYTGKYERTTGTVQPAQDHALTDEEQYQLQKIKDVLQEAEDTARESGLLED